MTGPDATGVGQTEAPPEDVRGPASRRRSLRTVVTVLAVVAALLVGDAVLVGSRIDEVDVDLRAGEGTTWVLVGTDSRAHLPAGASAADFGTTRQVPGSRADVVVVLHEGADGVTALSVPRDVVVRTDRRSGRLALTWLKGPQATVDALCQLGIPADHLVAVDLAGFAAVVDAAGGLEVDVPEPVRDLAAGLLVTEAGEQDVDGATALALVRSRHPEQLVDGRWVPAPADPDGRASAAGAVLSALTESVRGSLSLPWRLQSVAWAASGAVTVDDGTSVPELASLARADVGDIGVLPVSDPVSGTIARVATDATTAAVTAAGMSCRP